MSNENPFHKRSIQELIMRYCDRCDKPVRLTEEGNCEHCGKQSQTMILTSLKAYLNDIQGKDIKILIVDGPSAADINLYKIVEKISKKHDGLMIVDVKSLSAEDQINIAKVNSNERMPELIKKFDAPLERLKEDFVKPMATGPWHENIPGTIKKKRR